MRSANRSSGTRRTTSKALIEEIAIPCLAISRKDTRQMRDGTGLLPDDVSRIYMFHARETAGISIL